MYARSEEEADEAAATAAREAEGETSEDEVVHGVAEEIRKKKALVLAKGRREKDRNHPRMNRAALGMSPGVFEKHMGALGVETGAALKTMKAQKKRGRSATRRGAGSDEEHEQDMVDEGEDGGSRRPMKAGRGTTASPRPGFRIPRGSSKPPADEPRARSRSRARSASRGEPKPGEGFKDAKQKVSCRCCCVAVLTSGVAAMSIFVSLPLVALQHDAWTVTKKSQVKMNRAGRQGESDRHVGTKMPKHLFSGKRPGQATASHR